MIADLGCAHDWRLIEELPPLFEQEVDWNATIAFGRLIEGKLLVPPRTRWYCTRCRLIDTRDEPDPRTSAEPTAPPLPSDGS